MIKKNIKRMAGLTAVFCMTCNIVSNAMSDVSVQAMEGDTTHIVVIGDSVSTGAGLADGEISYVERIADYTGAEITNFAQDAYTTADILTCLDDAQVQAALSDADVILVTAGIHDIMDAFMVRANSFMEEFQFEKFTDVFTANLKDYGFTDESELIPYSNQMAADMKLYKDTAAANMQAITERLSVYQDAQIVYQTVYNLLDNIEMYNTLSAKRRVAYSSIMNPAGTVLKESYNDYLTAYTATQENCVLVDTYAGFAGNAWQYTNLYDLELNPNAAGHAWIADAIITTAGLEAAPALQAGDVNGDGIVDAEDSSLIRRFAAESGINSGTIQLTEAQQKAADVDENGDVDAYDSAQVLMYAAADGLGQHYEFVKDNPDTIANIDNTSRSTRNAGEKTPIDISEFVEIVDADPYQPEIFAGIVDADPYQPVAG